MWRNCVTRSVDSRFPLALRRATSRPGLRDIEALPGDLRQRVEPLSESQLNTRYRPEGWTIRQVVHHIPDSHMNSFIRFKWALTEDRPRIKAYDEERWAELGDYSLSIGDGIPAPAGVAASALGRSPAIFGTGGSGAGVHPSRNGIGHQSGRKHRGLCLARPASSGSYRANHPEGRMGEIMKSNREEKTSTLNQGRPPHSEASPQQRLLLPAIQASGRRSPPPGKSFPETGSPGPPARERFPFRPVGLEFRIRSLNRGLGHHCVAPEF